MYAYAYPRLKTTGLDDRGIELDFLQKQVYFSSSQSAAHSFAHVASYARGMKLAVVLNQMSKSKNCGAIPQLPRASFRCGANYTQRELHSQYMAEHIHLHTIYCTIRSIH
jgi:hypothetical protein